MADYVTADRADKVQPGDSIHLDPVVLTAPTPEDGWLLVDGVVIAGTVSFTFDDESTLNVPVNRIVRIWRQA